jgi:hypothetical protein
MLVDRWPQSFHFIGEGCNRHFRHDLAARKIDGGRNRLISLELRATVCADRSCWGRLRFGRLRGQIADQFFQTKGGRVEDCAGVKRRDDPSAELMDGVTESDGNGQEIHVTDRRDELAAEGVALTLFRINVGVAPRLIFAGDLTARFATRESIGAEADLRVLRHFVHFLSRKRH